MIEFTLSILNNIGIILFLIASIMFGFSTLSYVNRTEDYESLLHFRPKKKWSELNQKEQNYCKNALGLGSCSLLLCLVGNLNLLVS